MKFRKKPIVIDATQWFKNGDHPGDHQPFLAGGDAHRYEEYCFNTEGAVVRRYRHPEVSGNTTCKHCDQTMHVHGWIDTLEGGHIVCPGDWIITGVANEHYPCKLAIFEATYEPATDAVTGKGA